jgi:transglutaminase-like putative cysteine protease
MTKSGKRYWDLPSILLLGAALWISALRLWVTDWTRYLERVELLVIIGFVLGLALGKSIFDIRAVRMIAFLYTLLVLPWQLGLTNDSTIWTLRLQSLFGRISTTLWIFLHNQPVQDPILFLTSMSILYWVSSLIAAFMLVRYHRPWTPLAVMGVAVLLIEYYHPFLNRGSMLSALFIFCSLMLLGRLHYLSIREEWEDNHVAVDAEAGFDLSKGTIIAGLVLVIMAWNAPTVVRAFSPDAPDHVWVSVSWQGLRNRMSNMFAGLQSQVNSSSGDFGNNMVLGSGAAQGNEVVMTIVPGTELIPDTRFYWRGRSYNTYKDGQWTNTLVDMVPVPSENASLKYTNLDASAKISVTIRNGSGAVRTIYTPGLPIAVSRSAKAQVQKLANQEVDVVSVQSDQIVQAGEAYKVDAYQNVPTVSMLKISGVEYPDWVKNTYLQLPQGFPKSIANLAKEITVGTKDPYDKANAVTNYLRKTITYSTEAPIPPTGADPIEYFLFTSKKGYCNYYASAEVLMLRSLGIPARLAVGYAEGDVQQNDKYFTVRRKDSHAWPEVFFSGIGWVPFEPTVSQPILVLPAGTDNNALNGATPTPDLNNPGTNNFVGRQRDPSELDPGAGGGAGGPLNSSVPYPWVIFGSVLLLAAVFYGVRLRMMSVGKWKPVPQVIEKNLRRRGIQPPGWLLQWAHFTELSPIDRIYADIGIMVRILGGTPSAAYTPSEQVSTLLKLLPEGIQPASVVLEEYQRSAFSRYPADVQTAKQADKQLWRFVRNAWLRQRFHIQGEVH